VSYSENQFYIDGVLNYFFSPYRYDDLDKALDLVRAFVRRYPPPLVRAPPAKLNLRSTRTLLEGSSRPLVRMTSNVELPDDAVPPFLRFMDVEALHHRLIMFDRKQDLGYLKWVCKAYESTLRARRNEAFGARPRM